MTEFIPRDIPIYCTVNHADDYEKEIAIKNKAEWERYGFTNFKFQESYNRSTRIRTLLKEELRIGLIVDDNFKEIEGNSAKYKTQAMRFFIDFWTLARKLRRLRSHSIFIPFDTVIQKDIPADFLNYDVNVFKIHESYPDMRNGMLASPSFWNTSIERARYILAGHNLDLNKVIHHWGKAENVYKEFYNNGVIPNLTTNFDIMFSTDEKYTTKL